MTQLAGVSCSVLARQRQGLPTWQFWADGTYGPYLWETLTAIVRELGGKSMPQSSSNSRAKWNDP
ncbi:MAG TPA: hypothetical protein PK867_11350, partial [Pirellulales bacterium]|nr:hypothetical protein [Pirellulales bacterium]